MLTKLVNCITFLVVACLIAIQIDELNQPLILGHKALMVAMALSAFMAIMNALLVLLIIISDDYMEDEL